MGDTKNSTKKEIYKLYQNRENLKNQPYEDKNEESKSRREGRIRIIDTAIAERHERDGNYSLAAKYLSRAAKSYDEIGEYRHASKIHQHASNLYEKQLESIVPDKEKDTERDKLTMAILRESRDYEWKKAVEDRKTALLYKKTENMSSLRKALVRKLKLKHIVSLLVLFFISFIPKITGFAINSSYSKINIYSVFNIGLFILILITSYFYIEKQVLFK